MRRPSIAVSGTILLLGSLLAPAGAGAAGVEAPVIASVALDTASVARFGTATITASVTDDTGIHAVELSADGGATWVPMSLTSGRLGSASVTVRADVNVRPVKVVAGIGHTCLLRPSGSLACWGDNYYGELGRSTGGRAVWSPEAVPGVDDATDVAAGPWSTCIVRRAGTVECWGSGTGSNNGTHIPIADLSTATALSAGGSHTCALLADGRVACWGRNGSGQLGDGTTTDSGTTPVLVRDLSTATAIALGGVRSCALLEDRTVACWGEDAGEIPAIVPDLSDVRSLAMGSRHTCALLGDGGVRCWGASWYGGLGNGTANAATTPTPVVDLTGATAIGAGGDHTCAIVAGGSVACWGDNESGQVGPTAVSWRTLTPVATGLTRAVSLGLGYFHSCALLADGGVRCWGYDQHGQLGRGRPSWSAEPVAVSGLTAPTQLALGRFHSCALEATGGVRCWGSDVWDQLGRSPQVFSSASAAPVEGLTDATFIAAGEIESCAIRADRSVWCWGGWAYPATGVTIEGVADVVALASGANGSCAIVDGGTVTCWDLGDPAAPVAGLSGAVGIARGDGHACALLADGTVRCWGYNSAGQLGNGTTVNSPTTPVAVLGLSDATSIAAVADRTCAGRTDGTVACWGRKSVTAGRGLGLASGSTTAPAAVAGVGGATALATGAAHACAIVAEGLISCWGSDTQGWLGDPASPILGNRFSDPPGLSSVHGISGAVSIAANLEHTCALLGDATVRCWGTAGAGQLGYDPAPNAPLAISGLLGGLPVGTTELCIRAIDVDGLVSAAGACRTLEVRPEVRRLTVSRDGTGAGTVTSTPAGISCGATCAADLTVGTVVTLVAAPAAGSRFAGWSGDCTATSGDCVVALDVARSVTATFTALAPAVTTQPANQTRLIGKVASFTAAASYASSIAWETSTDGTTWRAVANATTGTYTRTVATADHGLRIRAVFTGPGGTTRSNAAILSVPLITKLSVTSGPVGKTITITGRALSGATPVTIGGVKAPRVIVVSPTTLVTSIPATTSGSLTVKLPSGTLAWKSRFAVSGKVAPTITGFTPTRGRRGSAVTLSGTNLAGVTRVTVGGVSAKFTVSSGTSLVLTVPSTARTGRIVITTAGGSATSLVNYRVL